ncbi:hypothetical protein EVA_02281 [gut metagenome]|uniref:Uncharacterized protein n=1 Tax=gut metagenome TaxID=749906 RepID=J9D9V7_9ZZZZ
MKHISGTQVDALLCSFRESEITPSTLKDMSKGQEIEENIVLRQRQNGIVYSQSLIILSISQHHALALPSRTAGIKDITEVFVIDLCHALVVFFLNLCIGLLFAEEVVKIHREMIVRMLLHLRIENDNTLKRTRYLQHTESHVVLQLFAHKEIANLGVIEHIGYLRSTAGRIKRNGNSTNTVSTKINEKRFGLILRKDSDILLRLHSQAKQCVGHLLNFGSELIPRDWNPLVDIIIAITQGGTFTVVLSLLKYQLRQVTNVLHKKGCFIG